MDWFDNDELFLSECEKGHKWERYVAHFLSLQGLKIDIEEQTLRKTIAEADQYKNTIDLECKGVRIEVKSRDIVFHTVNDFPYETILVDTVSGWEAKDPPPHLVLCVSQKTGAMIFLPATSKSKDKWFQRQRFDHVRKITDNFYEAPKHMWKPVDQLTTILKRVKT